MLFAIILISQDAVHIIDTSIRVCCVSQFCVRKDEYPCELSAMAVENDDHVDDTFLYIGSRTGGVMLARSGEKLG
jgi:hypothetical protein